MDIIIAYWSGSGHTARLAEHVAEGARGSLLDIAVIDEAGWHSLDRAAAIVLGTPTYMGSTAGAFKDFMDKSSDRWTEQRWADKIAAGFTVATYPGGDKLVTLTQLAVFAAQHGMIWVGQGRIGAPVNPEHVGINAGGYWLGLAASSSRDKNVLIDPGDAETARDFGARIAAATRRWTMPGCRDG